MSLINQMLQDLDARRAAHGIGLKLPSDVRPLPPARTSRWPWFLMVMAGVLGGAAGTVFFLTRGAPSSPVVVQAPAGVSVVSSGGTQAMTLPAAEASPDALEEPGHPAASSVPDALPLTSAQELGASLRLADVLSEPAKTQPAAIVGKTDRKEGGEGAAKEAGREPVKRLPEAAKTDEKRDLPTGKLAEPKASVASVPPAMPVAIEKKEAAALPRDRIETEYRKSIAAVNQGRVNQALDTLQEVLRQDSLHVAARQLLVRLLLEARRGDEAMLALQEGLQGQPAQTGWAMSLARLHVDRGELAAAAQILQHSMPAASTNPDYLGFSAHVLQRLGRYKEAAALYDSATRLAPGDGRWWLGLGLAMEAEGRNDQALMAFERARQTGSLSRELMTLVQQKLR